MQSIDGVSVCSQAINMALWMVIPVLRGKGFHANMVAWCPRKESGDKITVKSDSCGIFVIGPAEGIHYAFGPDQFGLTRPTLVHENTILLKHQKDKDGRPSAEGHEHEVPDAERARICIKVLPARHRLYARLFKSQKAFR